MNKSVNSQGTANIALFSEKKKTLWQLASAAALKFAFIEGRTFAQTADDASANKTQLDKVVATGSFLGRKSVKIDDGGLHLRIAGNVEILDVENVINCAGQEPLGEIVSGLRKPYHLVGGAEILDELDAKRAIDRGTRLAIAF